MLNLYQLQMFLAVVDSGSFSAAAEQLHVTQPAVSEGVRALEGRLGVRLFDRRGHRAAVTPEGTALIATARHLLTLAEQTEQTLLQGRGVVGGHLRLATATSAGSTVVAARLGAFLHSHPAATARLVAHDPAAVLDGVLDGTFDAGFLAAAPAHARLVTLPVATDEWVLLAPPGHAWMVPAAGPPAAPPKRKRGRPPLAHPVTPHAPQDLPDPTALRMVPLVLECADSPLGHAARRELRDGFDAAGLPWTELRAVLEVGGPAEVVAAVEAGAGVGLVPLTTLATYSGPATPFRLAGHPLPRLLVAVRDGRAALSPLAAAWWACLSSEF
ncbi:MAG: LysR family transcriptional regulator [Chloroflexota bacterium]|nr:LysR family transcriptional regulator [Chloroflexota bacterium]